mgnify:FL=1
MCLETIVGNYLSINDLQSVGWPPRRNSLTVKEL